MYDAFWLLSSLHPFLSPFCPCQYPSLRLFSHICSCLFICFVTQFIWWQSLVESPVGTHLKIQTSHAPESVNSKFREEAWGPVSPVCWQVHWDTVLLCSSDCPGLHYVVKTGPSVSAIVLPWPLQCWDHKCKPPHLELSFKEPLRFWASSSVCTAFTKTTTQSSDT